MISLLKPASLLVALGLLAAPVSASVLLDLSKVSPATSAGEDLQSAYVAANQSASITYDPGDGTDPFGISLAATGEGDAAIALRISDNGLGINTTLPNGSDTTFKLDETAAETTPETLAFSFSVGVSISKIGLADFGFNTATVDGEPVRVNRVETFAVTFGDTTLTFASDDAAVQLNQTVAGDPEIAVITFATPIELAPGETIIFSVPNDGDDSLSGADRNAALLQSIELTVVPEPGSLALCLTGLGLFLVRRR